MIRLAAIAFGVGTVLGLVGWGALAVAFAREFSTEEREQRELERQFDTIWWRRP